MPSLTVVEVVGDRVRGGRQDRKEQDDSLEGGQKIQQYVCGIELKMSQVGPYHKLYHADFTADKLQLCSPFIHAASNYP